MEKNKVKILFLDRNAVGPYELKGIFSKYGEYTELNLTNNDDIASYLKDYDVVILNRIRLGKKEFEKAPNLKLVLLTGTGYNHIDLVAAKEYGVTIANVANYSTNSVSQLTMTLLLNELTRAERLSQEVKQNKWEEISNKMDRYYHVDTEGKVLGILGHGNIGKRVEQYAKSFGMEVMIAKIPGREYTDNLENRFELDEVLEKCDIFSIHAPLTDLTRDLINLDRMKKMKKSAIILNLGRGPIINEDDLYYALKNKIIASAATDVMTTEPPKSDCKLLELDNFTVTPHLAWKSLIRAISIAKLMLKPNSILIDVGAGTGTIGIEAATYMPQGKVYAIEKEEKGLDTIRLNAEKFNLDNFELIYGKAPEAIPDIPYDRMFIGGSTGGIEEIINHFLTYAKDEAILVINCITLETQSKSLEILKEKGFKDIEIVTVTVGRAKRVGPYTMMFGENPICIIKVVKRNK